MIFKLFSNPDHSMTPIFIWFIPFSQTSPLQSPYSRVLKCMYVSEMGIKETKPTILWDLSYGSAVNIRCLKWCYIISYIRRLLVWWCQCLLYYKPGINNTHTKSEGCFFNNRKLVHLDFLSANICIQTLSSCDASNNSKIR